MDVAVRVTYVGDDCEGRSRISSSSRPMMGCQQRIHFDFLVLNSHDPELFTMFSGPFNVHASGIK